VGVREIVCKGEGVCVSTIYTHILHRDQGCKVLCWVGRYMGILNLCSKHADSEFPNHRTHHTSSNLHSSPIPLCNT
jgi:hypothetical protein